MAQWTIGSTRVAQNADGRLEVFAQHSDGMLWHNWQTAPNNGWSGWNSLGGNFFLSGRPVVFMNHHAGVRRLEVFVRSTGNVLWHNWQTAPNNDWTPNWAPLGGILTSEPVVFQNLDGRLEVFVRGTDNALYHK